MLLLFPQYLLAESSSVEIVDAVLARAVVNHTPDGVFEPAAFCGGSQDQDRAVPVVQSINETKVCLWTKVKASTAETLTHTWYKTGMGWEKMAEVTLHVKKSPGFRTWSCKKIMPNRHSGKWMVVIRRAADPETALCKVDFEIVE
jgi:hypothetical protein